MRTDLSHGSFYENLIASGAMARHFEALRPWTYFLTLTYGRWYVHVSREACRKDILNWAQYCQKLLGGMFEYVFVAEYVDPLEPPHLHGLLYLEAGRSPTIRRKLEGAWKDAHGLPRIKPVSEPYTGVAGYVFKDWGTEQPFYASPSLRDSAGA